MMELEEKVNLIERKVKHEKVFGFMMSAMVWTTLAFYSVAMVAGTIVLVKWIWKVI